MKKIFHALSACLLLVGLLGACTLSAPKPAPADDKSRTLASLKLVDDHPLYTMVYYEDYAVRPRSGRPALPKAGSRPGWACSLFSVLLDDEHRLYGRNFDWEFSPALLLFTHPADGYGSVSMVDFMYLGFDAASASQLEKLPASRLEGLLGAPMLPFDGMNEKGLAIGMAAVDPGEMQTDPSKETISSLELLREVLDHAADVDEALGILERYNIDFTGGPPLHYLIADAKRQAVLVEFYQGEMHIFRNDQPWHSATNFLRASVDDPQGQCWRYDRINLRFDEKKGLLDAGAAMQLLSDVAQDSTQWSVVYDMAHGQVSVAMGQDYGNVLTFQLSDYLK